MTWSDLHWKVLSPNLSRHLFSSMTIVANTQQETCQYYNNIIIFRMCHRVTIELTVPTHAPRGELSSATPPVFNIVPWSKPSVTRWMTSPASSTAQKAWEQLPSARHVCCPGGSFYGNHRHQVKLNVLNVCLTGSCRRCRFRTVRHCWGRTVTGGRWKGHSSLLWWTPPKTAYLRKIEEKSPITFKVLNKVIGIMYNASKSSRFISSPKGGSVGSTCSF